ncbi:hypothetical protein [Gottfriedia solisilvae]|uniref:Uncharacterized protein n=1 Tax=Gottfriedia solisilvae TaxID=1516104 RepID=A0A8J3AHD2_9BACI|nr:hypothetical protein [Gottfriedia solisilvae]GGI12885.1 hypothetical protein GCM10007380_15150 [Gottfriedia solisilvae]
MKKSKKSLWIGLIVIILIASTITYYKIPLKANTVFHNGEIKIIDFGFYVNGKMNNYNVRFKNTKEINQIVNIFNNTRYTRIPGNRNIRNDGKLLSMYVFVKEKNLEFYILDINDQGYLKVGKNIYKLADKHSQIFNELYEILVANRKPINE